MCVCGQVQLILPDHSQTALKTVEAICGVAEQLLWELKAHNQIHETHHLPLKPAGDSMEIRVLFALHYLLPWSWQLRCALEVRMCSYIPHCCLQVARGEST